MHARLLPICAILALLAPQAAADERVAVIEAGAGVAVYAGDNRWAVSARAASSRYAADGGDAVDVLVVFAAFPTTVDGGALYEPVANAVRGLNLGRGGLNPETFDHSAEYELAGLQGVIVVGSAIELPEEPSEAFVSGYSALGLLAHELGHRFGPFVRFHEATTGATRSALLTEGGGHWSPWLDTGGSPLGGNAWQRVGPAWARGDPSGRYHPLDLYLMGLLDPADVPPLRLLDDVQPSTDGTTWPATAIEITVADIVAVEGPRRPPHDQAQHEWTQAFLLLVLPGEAADPSLRARLGRLAEAWSEHFAWTTGGRGALETLPAPQPPTPRGAAPGCGTRPAGRPVWPLLGLRRS